MTNIHTQLIIETNFAPASYTFNVTLFTINVGVFLLRLKDAVEGGMELRSLAAAKYNTISPNLTPDLQAQLSYRSLEFQKPDVLKATTLAKVFIDSVTIADLHGNRYGKYSSSKNIICCSYNHLMSDA